MLRADFKATNDDPVQGSSMKRVLFAQSVHNPACASEAGAYIIKRPWSNSKLSTPTVFLRFKIHHKYFFCELVPTLQKLFCVKTKHAYSSKHEIGVQNSLFIYKHELF